MVFCNQSSESLLINYHSTDFDGNLHYQQNKDFMERMVIKDQSIYALQDQRKNEEKEQRQNCSKLDQKIKDSEVPRQEIRPFYLKEREKYYRSLTEMELNIEWNKHQEMNLEPDETLLLREIVKESKRIDPAYINGEKVDNSIILDIDQNNIKSLNVSPPNKELRRFNNALKIKLTSRNNTFRFAIRKKTFTDSVFTDGLLEKNKLIELIKEYFPNAIIECEVKAMDQIGVKISDFWIQLIIFIKIQDMAMEEEEFNETLNDLAEEFDSMHLEY